MITFTFRLLYLRGNEFRLPLVTGFLYGMDRDSAIRKFATVLSNEPLPAIFVIKTVNLSEAWLSLLVLQSILLRRPKFDPRKPKKKKTFAPVFLRIQGDTKERELLKCVVAAMCSWQRCATGTLSYIQPCHPVIMEQWNGPQRAFPIKMFYKNSDSLEGAQREFRHFFQFRAS